MRGVSLLLDTNFFIDASLKQTAFIRFTEQLKENNTPLVIIDAVELEFLRGYPSSSILSKRQALIDIIVDKRIDITPKRIEKTRELLSLMQQEGSRCSITDLFLASLLMQCPGELFLLTRNHLDFPTNIFTCADVVNFVGVRTIFAYGVYSYIQKS